MFDIFLIAAAVVILTIYAALAFSLVAVVRRNRQLADAYRALRDRAYVRDAKGRIAKAVDVL